MKTFYIYFDDLKEEVQNELLEFVGATDAKEMNWDVGTVPIATIELEENDGQD